MNLRTIVEFAVAWLGIGVLLAWLFLEQMPVSAQHWAFVLVLGPPLYCLGEAVSDWLFSPERGRAISRRRFSPARVGVAFLLAVPLVLAAIALNWMLGRLPA